MNLQDLVNGMSARMQSERAKSQMTLGGLISDLEKMPEGSEVANLHGSHSYRGYYCDLAFELGGGLRPASDLLAECRAAMGQVFVGYKGGDFVMGFPTPVWVASYGDCGVKLMKVEAGGSIVTEHDE